MTARKAKETLDKLVKKAKAKYPVLKIATTKKYNNFLDVTDHRLEKTIDWLIQNMGGAYGKSDQLFKKKVRPFVQDAASWTYGQLIGVGETLSVTGEDLLDSVKGIANIPIKTYRKIDEGATRRWLIVDAGSYEIKFTWGDRDEIETIYPFIYFKGEDILYGGDAKPYFADNVSGTGSRALTKYDLIVSQDNVIKKLITTQKMNDSDALAFLYRKKLIASRKKNQRMFFAPNLLFSVDGFTKLSAKQDRQTMLHGYRLARIQKDLESKKVYAVQNPIAISLALEDQLEFNPGDFSRYSWGIIDFGGDTLNVSLLTRRKDGKILVDQTEPTTEKRTDNPTEQGGVDTLVYALRSEINKGSIHNVTYFKIEEALKKFFLAYPDKIPEEIAFKSMAYGAKTKETTMGSSELIDFIRDSSAARNIMKKIESAVSVSRKKEMPFYGYYLVGGGARNTVLTEYVRLSFADHQFHDVSDPELQSIRGLKKILKSPKDLMKKYAVDVSD